MAYLPPQLRESGNSMRTWLFTTLLMLCRVSLNHSWPESLNVEQSQFCDCSRLPLSLITFFKKLYILSSSHYETKSFNVQPYGECVEYWDTAKTQRKHYSRWNNAAQCTAKGGLWQNFYNYLEKAPSKQMC